MTSPSGRTPLSDKKQLLSARRMGQRSRKAEECSEWSAGQAAPVGRGGVGLGALPHVSWHCVALGDQFLGGPRGDRLPVGIA